jgi:FKBP-type peptidyl-prolyl cis-trans isomerase SlpA
MALGLTPVRGRRAGPGFLQWRPVYRDFHDHAVPSGSFLTLHYRLAGPAGDIINTFDDKPATLSLGTGELSPAVEQRLIGLEEGARATFELAAGEAFGERNPTCSSGWRASCSTSWATRDEQYNVGDVVQFPTPDGRAATPARACRCATTARCCLTSTTRWPASR